MGCWTPPFGNPQALAGAVNLAELLAACAAGASVPLGKARARARSPRLPHLHRFGVGASPPCPCVPQRGKFAGHARLAPLPPRFPNGDVCRSCANAHGTASDKAFAATPSQISRKLLPRKRLGVPSLPSRGCAEGTLARPQRGNPKGGAALFGQSLPTFCWPESRGPARPERVEGKNQKLKKA